MKNIRFLTSMEPQQGARKLHTRDLNLIARMSPSVTFYSAATSRKLLFAHASLCIDVQVEGALTKKTNVNEI